jgi:hypothetical protein
MARALKNWRRRRGVSDSKNGDGYEVGYRKPPKSTQFQKGRSGNPSGRPKGSVNLATVLDRLLRERVTINENGRRKTMTRMEVALRQLVNRAMSADLSATRLLIALEASVDQCPRDAAAESPARNEADQKVMAQIVKRFAQSAKGE